jgi:hypothetical protein
MSAGAILIDQTDEGQFRATCPLLPQYEILADSEDAAREAMREAIALHGGSAPAG